jgi:hypothetical protein
VLLGWSQAPKSWATPSTDPSTVLAARDAPALRSAAAARIAAIVLYGNPTGPPTSPTTNVGTFALTLEGTDPRNNSDSNVVGELGQGGWDRGWWGRHGRPSRS